MLSSSDGIVTFPEDVKLLIKFCHHQSVGPYKIWKPLKNVLMEGGFLPLLDRQKMV